VGEDSRPLEEINARLRGIGGGRRQIFTGEAAADILEMVEEKNQAKETVSVNDLIAFGLTVAKKRNLDMKKLSVGWAASFMTTYDLSLRLGTKARKAKFEVRNEISTEDEESFEPEFPDVNIQTNSCDCGVYLLSFVEMFSCNITWVSDFSNMKSSFLKCFKIGVQQRLVYLQRIVKEKKTEEERKKMEEEEKKM